MVDGIRIMTYYYNYELNPDSGTVKGIFAEQRLTFPNSTLAQERLESSPC